MKTILIYSMLKSFGLFYLVFYLIDDYALSQMLYHRERELSSPTETEKRIQRKQKILAHNNPFKQLDIRRIFKLQPINHQISDLNIFGITSPEASTFEIQPEVESSLSSTSLNSNFSKTFYSRMVKKNSRRSRTIKNNLRQKQFNDFHQQQYQVNSNKLQTNLSLLA
jgi:hypothetical protein